MNKVYGIYPGNIKNLEEIEKLSEGELFLAINSLEASILACKRKMSRDSRTCFDITEDEYALEYLISKTKNFGVEVDKTVDGKALMTGDYAGWYEYHLEHFSKKVDMRSYYESKLKGHNIKRYLPENSYLEYKRRLSLKENIQRIKMPNKNV